MSLPEDTHRRSLCTADSDSNVRKKPYTSCLAAACQLLDGAQSADLGNPSADTPRVSRVELCTDPMKLDTFGADLGAHQKAVRAHVATVARTRLG